MDKLTKKQIEEKVKTLSAKYGKVTPFEFITEEGEQIIGFLKEPERLVKMRVLDTMMTSITSASEILLTSCLIREESDSRILSEEPGNDSIYISALMAAGDLVKFYNNLLKKK